MAVALAVALAGCLAGLAEAAPVTYWVAIAVALTAIASLALDAFGGIVAGLAGAAGLIAAKRLTGEWDADGFALSLVETLVLVATGTVSGRAGVALRTPAPAGEERTSAVGPAFGSLGLLPHDAALLRLEEEVERAVAHRRPLTLVLLDSEIVHPDLDGAARDAALRTVARILESRLHERDVPFAISPERLGAILPEIAGTAAWLRVGTILDAVSAASFMSRAAGERIALADAVRVRAGLAEVGAATSSADALLDAATTGIEQGPEVREPEPR